MINEKATVIKNEKLATGVYSTVFKTGIAGLCRAGQFVMIGTKSDSRLLRRPISICGADSEAGEIRLVYRVAGYGTEELSRAEKGDSFEILGPSGNGFPVDKAENRERILLIAGGIGAPPLLYLSRALKKAGTERERMTAVLGYRGVNAGIFLNKEFEEYAEVVLSSDDGSTGVHGTVMDAVREKEILPDIIYACGPLRMLKAVKALAAEKGIPAYISLEERMACGVGACLGCTVKTRHTDSHSHVNNARICTEGPVFEAEEVEI